MKSEDTVTRAYQTVLGTELLLLSWLVVQDPYWLLCYFWTTELRGVFFGLYLLLVIGLT